jgi:uncharacterized protein
VLRAEPDRVGEARRLRFALAAELRYSLDVSRGGDDESNWRAAMGKLGEIVRGVYEAFGRGDVPGVLGSLDNELDWREAESFTYADESPYTADTVAPRLFGRLAEDIPDFRVVPANFIEGGNSVVVEGRYQGTVKGTGARIDAQFVHVWELRDGKVVRFQQYTDTKQWSEAMGPRRG